MEVVVLYELIKVNRQQLKAYDQMLPKDRIVFQPDDIVHIIRIVFLQVHQDLELHSCLVMEPLFVSDNLHCHKRVCLIVIAFKGLAETTLTQKL